MRFTQKWFAVEAYLLGAVSGAAVTVLYFMAQPVEQAPAVEPPAPMVEVGDCAVRTVYFTATDDDWSQRALIAYSVLNQVSAPGVDARTPCAYPSPLDAGGPLPDPYLLQSARDAVDAVLSGSYEIPPACAAATAVMSSAAAPRAQCVVGSLAFVEAR